MPGTGVSSRRPSVASRAPFACRDHQAGIGVLVANYSQASEKANATAEPKAVGGPTRLRMKRLHPTGSRKPGRYS